MIISSSSDCLCFLKMTAIATNSLGKPLATWVSQWPHNFWLCGFRSKEVFYARTCISFLSSEVTDAGVGSRISQYGGVAVKVRSLQPDSICMLPLCFPAGAAGQTSCPMDGTNVSSLSKT